MWFRRSVRDYFIFAPLFALHIRTPLLHPSFALLIFVILKKISMFSHSSFALHPRKAICMILNHQMEVQRDRAPCETSFSDWAPLILRETHARLNLWDKHMTSGRINQFATHLWWPQSVTALTMHPEATPPGNHTRDMLQSKRFRMSLSPDSHDSLCLRYLRITDYPSNVHKNTFVGKQ